MRTTLNIDDDVLAAVRELARVERRSSGEILSALARRGLSGASGRRLGITERDGFPVLPSRGGIVTDELIDRIRGEEGI